jgi:hypothetical protein
MSCPHPELLPIQTIASIEVARQENRILLASFWAIVVEDGKCRAAGWKKD